MNLDHFKEAAGILQQNPNLSGFDLYYIGFFLFHAPKLSPNDVFQLVHRIFELYQNETINIQEKIKSLVRVLSKKIDIEMMQELKLVINDENENKAPLKDYFSQISDILPQYDKLEKIELLYLGHFHAKLPSYRISELLKHINNIKEIMAGSLTDEEARVNFLLKILNNKLKDANNLSLSGGSMSVSNYLKDERQIVSAEQTQAIEGKTGNDNSAFKNSPKRELKRGANSPLGEYDHQLKKIKKDGTLVSQAQNKNDFQAEEDFGKFEFSNKNSSFKRMTTKEEEELSRALIEKLQEDEKEEREELKAKLEVQNSVNCAICLDDLYATRFKPLEGCSHVFHEECMKEYLQAKIDEKGFPILCPELECKSEITLTDVVEFMDEKYQEKFESFSFKSYLEKNAAEVSCCPTADCPFAFVKEEDQSQLKCPVCGKHYCLNCRVVWHKGMTCKEYEVSSKRDENDVKFEKFVKGQQFKQCPKCGFWVSRIEGCNAMICRCKTQFCYNCGKEGDGHVCTCLLTKKKARALPRAPILPVNNNLFRNHVPGNLFTNPQPNQFYPYNHVPGNLFTNPQPNQFFPYNHIPTFKNPPNMFYNNYLPKVAPRKDDRLVGEEPSDADTLNSDDD